MTKNISTVVVNHSTILAASARRLREGKVVGYDKLIPLRHELEALFDEAPAHAVSLLGLVLSNESRKGTKHTVQGEDGKQKLLINWSGYGFGYNKEHRTFAASLKTRFAGRKPADFVGELSDSERATAVYLAKRYVKQGILSLILTVKG